MYNTLIGLKFALLRRSIFKKENLPVLLSIFFISLMFGWLFISTQSVPRFQQFLFQLSANDLKAFLSRFLSGTEVMGLVVFILFRRGYNQQFWNRMFYLPIKKSHYFFSEVLYSIFDLWILPVLLGCVVVITGIGMHVTFSQIIYLFLLSVLYLMLLDVFYHLLQSGLVSIIISSSKKYINIIGSVILGIIILGYLDLLSDYSTSHVFHYLLDLKILPHTLMTSGILNIIYDRHFEVFITIVSILLFTAIYLQMNYILYKKNLGQQALVQRYGRKKLFPLIFMDNFLSKVFTKSRDFIILFIKELVYHLRSVRTILGAVLATLAVMVNYSVSSSNYASNEKYFIIFMCVWAMPIFLSDFGYVFSYDRNSFKTYFSLPFNVLQIILTKNMIQIVKTLTIQTIYIFFIYIFFRSPVYRLSSILVIYSISIYLLLGALIFANYLNFRFPSTVQFHSLFGRSTSLLAISLTMLTLLIFIMPIGISMYYLDFGGRLFICILILLSLVTVLYGLSLKIFTKYLLMKRDFILQHYS